MQSRRRTCQQLHVPNREGLCGAKQAKLHQYRYRYQCGNSTQEAINASPPTPHPADGIN